MSSPAQQSQRRHLTTAFFDLVGSTSLSVSLDPEELSGLLQTYYDRCTTAIRRYEGQVVQFVGDGIVAVFGYPQAHEDDAERALRAALEVTASDVPGLQLRIGIASGLVVVQTSDGAGGPVIGVVGQTTNLAARLQAAGKPGDILIADSTRRLIGKRFALEPFDVGALKGFRDPVRAWQVLGESSSVSRFEARSDIYTPFVGREQELAMLRDRWRQASDGQGQVVLLSGEAGLGKSRLIETLRAELGLSGAAALRFQCSPHHLNGAFYPIIVWLGAAADIAPSDPPETKRRKLAGMLPPDDSPEQLGLLSTLYGIAPGPDEPEIDPDPERRKRRSLALLADLIVARAQPGGLIVFEDAHWADSNTLACFGRIVDRIAQSCVMLVASCRPELAPAWTTRPHATVLPLTRLPRPDCLEIVTEIAAGRPMPEPISDLLVSRADGVPLFLEELTKSVFELGSLRQEAGAWLAGSTQAVLEIPETLHDSLVARLDRLGGVREVAQIAAAIGREFSYGLLARIAELPDTALRSALERLEHAGLVFPQGPSPAGSYVFKHALVQEAAYQTLLRSRRVQLHRRIAQALERHLTDMASRQPELVAHHWTQAGDAEEAVRWWRIAGELAIHQSANFEAVGHFGRALDLVPKLAESVETELDIRIKLSGSLIATQGYSSRDVAQNYQRAWELCQVADQDHTVLPVLYGRWLIPAVKGDLRTARANSRALLERAQRQSDLGLLSIGHQVHGSTLAYRGEARASLFHLEKALSLYRPPAHDALSYQFGHHPPMAALVGISIAQQHLGQFGAALAAGDEAIGHARRLGHFNSLAFALSFLGVCAMVRRDEAKLECLAQELCSIATQNEAPFWLLWGRSIRGWLAARRGALEEGLSELRACWVEFERLSFCFWVPFLQLAEAELLVEAGRLDGAADLIEKAAALVIPLEQGICEIELHRVRAALFCRQGRPFEEVVAPLDAALAVASRQEGVLFGLRACVAKVHLSQGRAEAGAAREALAQLLGRCTRDYPVSDVAEAEALLRASAA